MVGTQFGGTRKAVHQVKTPRFTACLFAQKARIEGVLPETVTVSAQRGVEPSSPITW